jgi:hypothetical protein
MHVGRPDYPDFDLRKTIHYTADKAMTPVKDLRPRILRFMEE